MLNFTPILELLNNVQNIVITTHTNPDGDAIGSSLALYSFLINLNKNVDIIIYDSCPDIYKFLHFSERIQRYGASHNSVMASAEVIFILDCGTLQRVNIPAEVISQSNAKKVLVDHHLASEHFTDFIYSDTNVVSTGEIIYELLIQAKAIITKEISEALFTAIYTDSGGFRYQNTSYKTFFIAAELVKNGVVPNYIYDNIYNSNSINKIRLHGMALSEMKSYFESKLIIVCVSLDMLKWCEANNEDLEGLSQAPLTIKNSQAAVIITEYRNCELRISLRSKGDIDVQSIALKYSGGGHKNASGCKLHNIDLKKARNIFANEFAAIFEN